MSALSSQGSSLSSSAGSRVGGFYDAIARGKKKGKGANGRLPPDGVDLSGQDVSRRSQRYGETGEDDQEGADNSGQAAPSRSLLPSVPELPGPPRGRSKSGGFAALLASLMSGRNRPKLPDTTIDDKEETRKLLRSRRKTAGRQSTFLTGNRGLGTGGAGGATKTLLGGLGGLGG